MIDTKKITTHHHNISTTPKPLIITSGEPAGIGMDIILQLASAGQFSELKHPVWVLADAKALALRAQMLMAQGAISRMPSWQLLVTASSKPNANKLGAEDGVTEIVNQLTQMMSQRVAQQIEQVTKANSVDFWLIDIPCQTPVTAGVLNLQNASMVMQQLTIAHQLAYTQLACAIVTAPIQKSILIDANIHLKDGTMFTGHTEFFMQQSGCNKVVMMLANKVMKVALVTTHLPLKQVATAITKPNVTQTISIVLQDLTTKFGIDKPRILVCGLNPHAGEGGHLGMEEIDIINPVLKQFQAQGVDISDALPADTLFTQRHLAKCDAVIAMYHDQGLPVLKSHGFGDTVNLTLGLPYIRTSVDHGTALDLAGLGQASASSLWQALVMADNMASNIVTPL